VISDASPRVRLTRESQVDKLTRCEDDLSQIAENVAKLLTELDGLRSGSEDLCRLLAERDALVEQQRSALAKHEDESTRLQQQAAAASEALRAAETRLSEHDERGTAVKRELDDLRGVINERERHLTELSAQHDVVCDVLAMRQGELEQARADAATAMLELAELQRIDGLAEPDTSAGHVRLLARPDGYAISESEDPCPRPGDVVGNGAGECVVVRVGRSPFPGDTRRCAVLSVAQR
jgi:chromosome segregation ATPase